MATVPGTPGTTINPALAPTQADILIAAGIMHQQGRFNNDDNETRLQLLLRSTTDEPEGPTSKVLVPGERVPDQRLGVPGKRDVRGI